MDGQTGFKSQPRLLRLEVVEHGHAGGDTVLDLVVDDGALVVHDRVAKLHAAVHGAGVHEVEAALADLLKARIGDTVEAVVFADRGEKRGVLPLHLDAEEIDDVGESAGINRLGIENERVLQRTTSH